MDHTQISIHSVDYVLLGSTGFLGQETCKILKNKRCVALSTRLEDTKTLKRQLKTYNPKYVICAAGISGKPSVQWCETHREDTLFVNLTLQLHLAHICHELNIHLTIYGSGLLYDGKGLYNEDDPPNLSSSYYSNVRALLEKSIGCYNNILYLRILYPFSGTEHPKCIARKLRKLMETKSIHDRKVNITVLPDLLPKMISLIENGVVGIFNFVNPGLISLKEIVETVLGVKYETNDKTVFEDPELDTAKLQTYCPEILDVKTALKKYVLL